MSYAPAASTSFLAGLSRVTGFGVFARLSDMFELRHQRLALAKLNADQLTDIGLTVHEAETEAARPAWDAPDHWFK